MRIVFLGDSHLARVRRDLRIVGSDVHNAAQGGAAARDLPAQATSAALRHSDLLVVSVGTNDAAPWKQVPLTTFERSMVRFLESAPTSRGIYLTPPGVDETRLTRANDRTNESLDLYRDAALAACRSAGMRVVRTERVIEPLGTDAFVSDGLHLSGPAYKVVLGAIANAVHEIACGGRSA